MNKILEFVREINPDVPDSEELDLISEGYIDSFGVFSIVVRIELNFDVIVREEEMTYDNFRSIHDIKNLLISKGVEESKLL